MLNLLEKYLDIYIKVHNVKKESLQAQKFLAFLVNRCYETGHKVQAPPTMDDR